MLEATLGRAGKEWGAFMRLSRRAAVGILLTGASVLISGNFLATEALAAQALIVEIVEINEEAGCRQQ
jgi:hypothetical protein